MPDSLIPERPLLVSPSLAAAIGLEQALLLQHLEQCSQLQSVQSRTLDPQFRWGQCSLAELGTQLPFWTPAVVRRHIQGLVDLGMLVLNGFPESTEQPFYFAINQASSAFAANRASSAAGRAAPRAETTLGAHKLPGDWQPNPAVLEQLASQGVDPEFVQASIADFVFYWRERNEVSHAWSSKFLNTVSRRWEQEQQRRAQQEKSRLSMPSSATEINRRWQPSEDAIEVLLQMGIHRNFIVDAIPEFVLYWQERGTETKTWNSKFVSHVKRQWASYTHALKHDTEPRPIADNWQPDQEVFDILQLANISADFARSLIPEFVMYWRERNELYHSWNTRFLQHVKRQWSHRHSQEDGSGANNPPQANRHKKTRQRTLAEDLTDRSWAG